jgi:hypothetical protein
MAIVLVGGSLLVTLPFQLGLMGYLLFAALLVVLPGSAVAAAVGRSFRSGLWACAWAVGWPRRCSSPRGWPRDCTGIRQVGGRSWTRRG